MLTCRINFFFFFFFLSDKYTLQFHVLFRLQQHTATRFKLKFQDQLNFKSSAEIHQALLSHFSLLRTFTTLFWLWPLTISGNLTNFTNCGETGLKRVWSIRPNKKTDCRISNTIRPNRRVKNYHTAEKLKKLV